MTTPPHILLIEAKRPKDRTPEEVQALKDWRQSRAALFAQLREKYA